MAMSSNAMIRKYNLESIKLNERKEKINITPQIKVDPNWYIDSSKTNTKGESRMHRLVSAETRRCSKLRQSQLITVPEK